MASAAVAVPPAPWPPGGGAAFGLATRGRARDARRPPSATIAADSAVSASAQGAGLAASRNVGRPAPQGEQGGEGIARAAAAAAARVLAARGPTPARYAAGTAFLAALLLLAGAAPWLLPAAYVSWAAVCLPWRAVAFHKKKWTAFLLDFCYWVNLATVYVLVVPVSRRVEAAVYALADGPLAGALVAWQCAWVFDSPTQVTSVLIHLLPGLALYARRHYSPPPGAPAWLAALAPAPPPAPPPPPAWLLAGPIAFYLAWQLAYAVVVQGALRTRILAGGYDTSYRALARRAAAADNLWNRLVRGRGARGGPTRRVMVYGALQAAYTAGTLVLALPLHTSFAAATVWQAAKLAVPLWHGAVHTVERAPRRAVQALLDDPAFVRAVSAQAASRAAAAAA